MTQLPVRFIQVAEVGRITPHMARITFSGDDLADLALDGPDQQVKLYFPRPGQAVPRLPEPAGDVMRWYTAYTAIPEPERPWMRSYTIRAHDPRRGTITVDFVLHGGTGPATRWALSDGDTAPRGDAGPATRWALAARPGDTLGMFGPSADFARPVPLTAEIAVADWLLLAGDETALPAIGTLIESLPPGARAEAYIEVGDAGEEQRFGTRGEVTVHWLHRNGVPAGYGDLLAEAVRGTLFPEGKVFAWLGGEAGAVRAIRRHLIGERGLDRRSIEFAGYWRPRLTQDDAPTEDDLADAREHVESAGLDQTYEPGAVGDRRDAAGGHTGRRSATR